MLEFYTIWMSDIFNRVGWDRSVDVVIRYKDRSKVGSRFSAPVQIGPGAHPASHTMGSGSFPGVKRPGRGVDHPPTCSAEVKEIVELNPYSPSASSWPVQKWTSLQMDFTSLVLPCCILLQMSRWVWLVSTAGLGLASPTMSATIQGRTVGPSTKMEASTTGGAMNQLPSYVNGNCGRWQVILRDKNRPDLGNGYSR